MALITSDSMHRRHKLSERNALPVLPIPGRLRRRAAVSQAGISTGSARRASR